MIIQLLGMDAKTRTEVGLALADRINAWHVLDTDLPHAQLQPQHARWLRSFASLYSKQEKRTIILNGYFPSKEAREQFREGITPDVTVWVNTTDQKSFIDKFDVEQFWEDIDPSEYNFEIKNTGDAYLDALPTRAFSIIKHFNLFDWKPNQTMMVGSFQNWGKEHVDKYNELSQTDNVIIGVKHCSGMTEDDKMHFNQICEMIKKDIPNANIIKVPNINKIVEC
jgi:hypothetical protein